MTLNTLNADGKCSSHNREGITQPIEMNFFSETNGQDCLLTH